MTVRTPIAYKRISINPRTPKSRNRRKRDERKINTSNTTPLPLFPTNPPENQHHLPRPTPPPNPLLSRIQKLNRVPSSIPHHPRNSLLSKRRCAPSSPLPASDTSTKPSTPLPP